MLLKELVVEVRGERARASHVGCILRSRTLRSETMSFHADETLAWEVNLVRGEAGEVEAFRRTLTAEAYPTMVRLLELDGGPTWTAYFQEWQRPAPGEGVSVPHLFRDHLQGKGSLRQEVLPRRGTFHALSFDGEALGAFHRGLVEGFGADYEVRLVHLGAPRFAPPRPAGPGAEELALARLAMDLGYFEEPRRASVRDVAAAAGVSKTAVAHRLRRLERVGVEALLGHAPVEPPPWPRA